jgi:hypothetical protein
METAPQTNQAAESNLDHDRLQLLLKVNNAVVTQLSLHDLASRRNGIAFRAAVFSESF